MIDKDRLLQTILMCYSKDVSMLGYSFHSYNISITKGCLLRYTHFFISNTSMSNARLKLAKNLAKAKQNVEAELLLLENYVVSSSTLSSKDNRRCSKKCAKNKHVYLNVVI